MLQPSLVLFVLNFWLPELCNDSIKERATLFDSLQLSSIPWGVIAFEVLYCYRKPSVLFIPVICYFQSSCTKPGLHIPFLIVVCCCCFLLFFSVGISTHSNMVVRVFGLTWISVQISPQLTCYSGISTSSRTVHSKKGGSFSTVTPTIHRLFRMEPRRCRPT